MLTRLIETLILRLPSKFYFEPEDTSFIYWGGRVLSLEARYEPMEYISVCFMGKCWARWAE